MELILLSYLSKQDANLFISPKWHSQFSKFQIVLNFVFERLPWDGYARASILNLTILLEQPNLVHIRILIEITHTFIKNLPDYGIVRTHVLRTSF